MPYLLVTLLLVCPNPLQENFWKILAEVSYEKVYDKDGFEIDKPLFSAKLKSFDRKRVKLKGYVIPVNEMSGKNILMLSMLPFSTCYFCGGAGPETVVEVQLRTSNKVLSGEIWIEGTLKLNQTDIEHHMYILVDASVSSL